MPSMPMLTTPERSHHRPAMAPSAIGVLRRERLDQQLHHVGVRAPSTGRAPGRCTSGMKRTRGDQQRAAGEPRRAALEERGDGGEHEDDADRGHQRCWRVEGDLQRVGRRLEGEALGRPRRGSAPRSRPGTRRGARRARRGSGGGRSGGGSRRPPTRWRPGSVVERVAVPPSRFTRKMVRTMTSAATNSSTRAWTIRTASIERPALLLHQAGAREHRPPQDRREDDARRGWRGRAARWRWRRSRCRRTRRGSGSRTCR